ncbi:MAG: hypothetical protein AAGC65_18820 [Mucilaginibacter sp.]|uniref:hypothetical protein n=1 Tax=Mucilaginibacter sp. TaxID=1882438 RepID=UPI0031ABFA23
MKYSCKVIVVIGMLALMGCDSFFNKTIYLNTQKMQESDKNIGDSEMELAFISAYFCHKNNVNSAAEPWADLFICSVQHKGSQLVDTILVLDTNLRKDGKNIIDDNRFSLALRNAKKLNNCKVLAPEKWRILFNRYKYKYASVTIATDD